MALKQPKKKHSTLELKSALPLVFNRKGELTMFHANLSALGTCIGDPTEMEMIYTMGFFGKGSLSKSYPSFGRSKYGAPAVVSNRQWQRRQEWINEVRKLSQETNFNNVKNDSDDDQDNKSESLRKRVDSQTSNGQSSSNDLEIISESEKLELKNENDSVMEVDEIVLDSTEEEDFGEITEDDELDTLDDINNILDNSESVQNDEDLQSQLLVLPDSDSDTENYLKNIKPEVKAGNFPVRETLHLTFEETFFLMYGLGCLRLVDFDGKFLNMQDTWSHFCKEQKHFLEKYVTYHYFRSQGWVVKPGLKYGGDYLLYKDGPPFYHSSYIVIIDVLDGITLKRIDNRCLRNMSWNNFIGLERMAECASKEILIAQLLWPSSIPSNTVPSTPEVLSQFTVREVLWKRWKLNQNLTTANIESNSDEDNDDDDDDDCDN